MINFGSLSGFFLFFRVELLKTEAIKIDGFKWPLNLRSGTTDILVFREVFLFKVYALDTQYQPAVIIDGGANIGLTSVFLAQRFTHSRIYSIEPDKSNFEMLRKNTEHYSSVVPIHSALWNRDALLRISNRQTDSWAFEVEECQVEDDKAFQGLSLNSIMKRYGINRIDILKLDIEGSERELFTDNYDYWISHTKYILVELHDWMKTDCSRTVFRTLSEYRFSTTIFNGMLLLRNLDID